MSYCERTHDHLYRPLPSLNYLLGCWHRQTCLFHRLIGENCYSFAIVREHSCAWPSVLHVSLSCSHHVQNSVAGYLVLARQTGFGLRRLGCLAASLTKSNSHFTCVVRIGAATVIADSTSTCSPYSIYCCIGKWAAGQGGVGWLSEICSRSSRSSDFVKTMSIAVSHIGYDCRNHALLTHSVGLCPIPASVVSRIASHLSRHAPSQGAALSEIIRWESKHWLQ